MNNTPITRYQSKLLPMGFTPTSDGFNRKRRRSKEFLKMLKQFSK